MKVLFDILGIIGLVLILLAFFLLQRNKLSDDDHAYNLLNIVGGIALGVYGVYYKAWFSVILNAVWAVVAVWDLVKNLKK
jgi:drug/metabolite transporter (DMT)-like permease